MHGTVTLSAVVLVYVHIFFPYGRNCQQVSMFGLYSYHAVMDTHTNDLNKNLLIHGKIELIII